LNNRKAIEELKARICLEKLGGTQFPPGETEYERLIAIYLAEMAGAIRKVIEIEETYPKIFFPFKSFHLTPFFRWPCNLKNLLHVLDEGKPELVWNIGNEEDCSFLARRIVRKVEEQPQEIIRIVRDIERVIKYCKKRARRLKKAREKLLQNQKKTIERIKGNSTGDFYEICQNRIVSSLLSLSGKIDELLRVSNSFPLIPLPSFPVFWFASFKWPAYSGCLYYIMGESFVYHISNDSSFLAREIIEKTRGIPVEIQKALNEIERAICWVEKARKKLERAKERLLKNQKKEIEKIRARLPSSSSFSNLYEMFAEVLTLALIELAKAVKDEKIGIPLTGFAPGIIWPSVNLYCVRVQNDIAVSQINIKDERNCRMLAWKIIEKVGGEPRKILEAVRKIEECRNMLF